MKIRLTDISKDGHRYNWTRQTGEINSILADLIGSNTYEADFFIKALNSRDYEMTGRIVAKTPQVCSRCASEIDFPIDAKFHEILIPKQEQPRNAKYGKVNHVSDLHENGIEVSEYENLTFDMGEFLHEVIGLAIPFNPACMPTADGTPPKCGNPLTDQPFIYNEEMPVEKPQNPFAALKNLKLN